MVTLHLKNNRMWTSTRTCWLNWSNWRGQLLSCAGYCWLVIVHQVENRVGFAQWTIWVVGCCWRPVLLVFIGNLGCVWVAVLGTRFNSWPTPYWSMLWMRRGDFRILSLDSYLLLMLSVHIYCLLQFLYLNLCSVTIVFDSDHYYAMVSSQNILYMYFLELIQHWYEKSTRWIQDLRYGVQCSRFYCYCYIRIRMKIEPK